MIISLSEENKEGLAIVHIEVSSTHPRIGKVVNWRGQGIQKDIMDMIVRLPNHILSWLHAQEYDRKNNTTVLSPSVLIDECLLGYYIPSTGDDVDTTPTGW